MNASWDHLPRASVLVCATVLVMGTSTRAHAEGEPETSTQAPAADDGATEGENAEAAADELGDVDRDKAPTCGPCCHGSPKQPECNDQPPPIEPAAKQGCAVHPGAPEQGGFAMLALVLALARRRQS